MNKPNIEAEKEFHEQYFSDHMSRKTENQFYDKLSKDIILNDIFDNLPDLKGKKVLYYGCGENIGIYERFVSMGAQVFLFDLSEVALKKIKNKHNDVKVTVIDAHNLAYKDEQFDLVFGRAILHHLDIETALSEIKRVINPEGKAVFIEPLGINPVISLYRLLTPKSRTKDERPFEFKEIEILKEHFPNNKNRYYFFSTLIVTILRLIIRKPNGLNSLFINLNKFDQFLFRVIGPLKYLSWISVFELRK